MKASDNPFPSVLIEEQGSTPASPAAGAHRFYIDGSGVLKLVNSSGTVVAVAPPPTVVRDRLAAVGAETHYNLGATPVAHSPLVWKNNVILVEGTDYTIAGSVITLTAALTAGQVIAGYYLTYAASAAGNLS